MTKRVAPTPANPHRTGHQPGMHPEDQPSDSQEFAEDVEEDESFYTTRLPTSARRYELQTTGQQKIIQQGNKHYIIHNEPPPRQYRRAAAYAEPEPAPARKTHWLLYLGIAMIIMIAGYVLISAGAGWWQAKQDDWKYGNPRTFQTDAIVWNYDGKGSTSHFIAQNWQSHVEVIEYPAGNAAKAIIYQGPTIIADHSTDVPITLSFQDVNNDGILDMIITAGNDEFVYLNTNGKFVPKN